ncbi:sulfatase-like hydrolase/transferase [Rubrobacter tropicus]|uniref:Sulfatase-like hydrolase/transferase n=1 Tax=Rubrobacter tropicus TaxID=2653851 RepID=A0A6G8Q788_9ACTN|nr:sulfatase [Rubrobacter tropicus]QIN82345.1 sulfatase-like hydrolase/transferase [Rubrobacter tropicus]
MNRAHKSAATFVLSLLAGLALVFALWADAGLGNPAGRAQVKPNIVFVLTDDQMPGTENRMPALQNNLVRGGVKFSNTVSTYPLCCPGRAVIQRGQYPHNTKIYGNSEPQGGWEKFQRLRLHQNTVATWLDGAGYQTGLFGKYMNNYRDRLIPPGWDRWYAWNGVDQGWTSVNDQGNVKNLDRQQADVLVADKATAFLKSRLDGAAPVFAFVNFGAMHEPYPSSDIDADKFKGLNVPRTPAFNEDDVSDKNPSIRNLNRLSRGEISDLDSQYRQSLRSLQRVDRFIGNASDILRRHGEMDDTYFVFYTDNGAHFGQHRLTHGKLQPYEEDINFPLILRGPGIRSNVVEPGLVGNHDIAPTIADMANAQAPAFVDGRSVMPLATGAATAWPRTAVLSIREPDLNPPPQWGVLRMQNQKYIRFQNGAREYYDLATDPHEVDSDPGAVSAETRDHWERRIDEIRACSGQECQAAENAPTFPPPAAP